MKFAIIIFFLVFNILNWSSTSAANWCKVIYNKETSDGEVKKQLSQCKNSDNIFIAINSGFSNSGHLLNSLIAENCDLRRKVLSTVPRKGDPYFTAVCEFRRHILR